MGGLSPSRSNALRLSHSQLTPVSYTHLVTLHSVHQRFSRHGQELLFEVGGQHHRPLDQCSHFFQQGVVQIGHATEGGSGRFDVSPVSYTHLDVYKRQATGWKYS